LPAEEPFSRRAARLESATRPADILGAAQALDDLTRKL
jgi:class 3 adenylate cyclase